MSISCSSRQDVKKTEEFCKPQANLKKHSKPKSKHENLEGHNWLKLKLSNGPWMEYQKIGNTGEVILFVCGIDDSIVSFSKMPDLVNKAKKGRCQLYYVNCPGNGYSTVPDSTFFNPIYLRNCLAEF